MGDLDFDIDLDLDLGEPSGPQDKAKTEEPEEKPRGVVTHRLGHRHLTRKAASEHALEEAIDWHFREGDCYHCLSFGDVDSMSYFKHVLRQQRIIYAGLSTWCMAGEDVADLQRWHDRGMLGRVDLYVGEIFRGSYPMVYTEAQKLVESCGGRIVVFRNHSKVMVIHGERFDCLIESSANINTNPRAENTVVTVDRELVRAYAQLFAEIKSFARDYDDIAPYTW